MSLNPIVPRLRRFHYDARSAAKVQLIVQPGDTLEVSDDVARQLERASQQFKDVTVTEPADETPAPDKPKRQRKPKPAAAAE